MSLDPKSRLDIHAILKDLEHYHPHKRGWVWRDQGPQTIGGFVYEQASPSLKRYVPLPSARHLNHIDPQPGEVITTEIASGRFEDDIRRMRMAAWHGADHIMVIRTAGQSHFDGLLEGSPQGIGGIPVTRKQVRAQRRALDLIEEEVGRPINYHSYVSGVAGPEIAVMFAEEGVNGAHQDPQYNVLYRNINMVRSFVDAAESKTVMAYANMAQIDGAHNANATARDAWKVMPELLVQHIINSRFSEKCGITKDNICLSTVPPAASPTPDLKLNLPYAVALREFLSDYKMRAQMNTKYMDSSTREATVTHVLNLLVTRLTSADIQSTITPDEGRNVPWHVYNIEALDTAKQALIGMDDLLGMVELKQEGYLQKKKRDIQERAILMMEDILAMGGYFEAVQRGMFVDSGEYPDRNNDGIRRDIDGGVGAGTVIARDDDYMAPVTAHYGYNNVAQYDERAVDNPATLIGGCTFERPETIRFIDELDESDNVYLRLEETEKYRSGGLLRPEVQWLGDGTVVVDLFFATDARTAEAAALVTGQKMNLRDVEVIHKEVLHPSEGTRIQIKGTFDFDIPVDDLVLPEIVESKSEDDVMAYFKEHKVNVIAGTAGNDEHSVGIREVLDIKHGGIEKYGITYHYLGTSVPIEKFVDAAIETKSQVIMMSTIISHDDVHYKNMIKLHNYAVEKGVREQLILLAGGTQVTPEIARQNKMDQGFGRGTKGIHIASFLIDRLRAMHDED